MNLTLYWRIFHKVSRECALSPRSHTWSHTLHTTLQFSTGDLYCHGSSSPSGYWYSPLMALTATRVTDLEFLLLFLLAREFWYHTATQQRTIWGKNLQSPCFVEVGQAMPSARHEVKPCLRLSVTGSLVSCKDSADSVTCLHCAGCRVLAYCHSTAPRLSRVCFGYAQLKFWATVSCQILNISFPSLRVPRFFSSVSSCVFCNICLGAELKESF